MWKMTKHNSDQREKKNLDQEIHGESSLEKSRIQIDKDNVKLIMAIVHTHKCTSTYLFIIY